GQSSVETIVEARIGGPFRSIFEFAERVGQRALNKRVLESLVCAGAFDSLKADGEGSHLWRARLFAASDAALARGARTQRDRLMGQNDLFGGPIAEPVEFPNENLPEVEAWTHTHLLTCEKNSLGFYITGHPLDNYLEIFNELKCPNSLQLCSLESGARVQTGGVVTALQVRSTKKGDRFALMRLEDQAGGVKCVVWPETYNKSKALLQDDAAVLLTGKLEIGEEGGATIIADEVARLDEVLQRRAKAMIVRLPSSVVSETQLEPLWKILDRYKGSCEVLLEMFLEGGVLVRTRAHGALRVEGSLALENALRDFGCEVEWANGARASR
ncbi:MAG: OB-fold nucleic acid binding domain-containing protein, partial [Pyrinomonadaceae bacterium]